MGLLEIYTNDLRCEEDLRDLVLEGAALFSFPKGRLRLENALDESEGQKANFVLWFKQDFPKNIMITWEFRPITNKGLAMIFFAAKGRHGEDLFDPALAVRTGVYNSYFDGDINAFHASYFRRKLPDERAFHTCNLRKSKGLHMVKQGADPIPDVEDITESFKMKLIKKDNHVSFFINELEIFHYIDDEKTFGPMLEEGKIGLRQMAPLIAEYENFKVYAL